MLVKHMVIQKARTSVAMCGHEKFSCLMPYTFAKLEDMDYVICDEPAPKTLVSAAKTAGVILL